MERLQFTRSILLMPMLAFLLSVSIMGGLTPAAAARDASGVNDVYRQLADARAAGDVAGMASAFAPEGMLIDSRPGPAITGSELALRLQPMAERLRADGVKMETAYRIERRTISWDVVLDAGFMRQTMTRPDGRTSARYARFLVTMQIGPNGRWRIIGDASMPADQAAFDGVARVVGLHFDG